MFIKYWVHFDSHTNEIKQNGKAMNNSKRDREENTNFGLLQRLLNQLVVVEDIDDDMEDNV